MPHFSRTSESWAVAKKPGKVSLFFIFTINIHSPLSDRCLDFVQKLSPSLLCDHENTVALPALGHDKKISEVTSYRWLLQLGFRAREYSKGLYHDGRECPDVVQYRQQYLQQVAELQDRSREFVGDKLDQSIQVEPDKLNGQKETVFLFHNESTVHANKRPRLAWITDNTNELRKKSPGRLIHDSDWIVEASSTGRLVITPQDEQEAGCRPQPTFSDASMVTYPGANGDKWWDCAQLVEQVKTQALPIFNYLVPNAQVSLFLTAHLCMPLMVIHRFGSHT